MRLSRIRCLCEMPTGSHVAITIFASLIAVGVAYNNARISLAERARELGSLRVLGFHRREVNHILLGELAILTAIAIPVGWVLGYALAALMVGMFDTEIFRIPLVVRPATYGYAALVVAGSTIAAAAIVARRVSRMDLVQVLKTRE